jgi:hypothetical protein
MRGLRIFLTGVVAGLSWAAISKELELPPEQRTWQGSIGGVPYNFRVWEWRDIAREYWNPASDEMLSPKVIGVGWGVNFAAVGRRAQNWLRQTTPPRHIER